MRKDGDWHDRMYNNRELVPDHPLYIDRWTADSQQAREELPCDLDVRYGDGQGETLDIFRGPDDKAPVLLFIHGGYWRALDKRDHSFIAPAFTRDGACVVVPNYALCPAVTIPQIVLQMAKAVAWTFHNIARYGGNPRHITVVGHSAGGHLAAMMLACLWQQFDPRLPRDTVSNALAVSGLHDLDPMMRTPFLQRDLRLTPQQVAKASPARLPPPRHGMLYTVTGADESAEYLRQNRLIQENWGARRVPVCEDLPGLNHFSVVDALADPSHRLHQLALDLLRS